MKALYLLLIFSQSVSASSIEKRLLKINKNGDIRMEMHLCGYSDSNMKLFKSKLIKENDIKKLECLESKDFEVKNIESIQKLKEDNYLKSRKYIKETNCATLSGFMQNVCYAMGGK